MVHSDIKTDDVKLIVFSNGIQCIANVKNSTATHLEVTDMFTITLTPPKFAVDENGRVIEPRQQISSPKVAFEEFSDFAVLNDNGDGVNGLIPHGSYMFLTNPIQMLVEGFNSRTSRIQVAKSIIV